MDNEQPDMTVYEIAQARGALKLATGSYFVVAFVSGDVLYKDDAPCACVSYIVDGKKIEIKRATWREAFTAAYQAYLDFKFTVDAETLRKMAVQIITETYDHGVCTENALRMAGFSQSQIKIGGSDACRIAAEMAGSGPFEIILEGVRIA